MFIFYGPKEETWGTWLKDFTPDEIWSFIEHALAKQGEDILKELNKIEAEKWKDCDHCSCLRYAIDKLSTLKK